MGRPKHISDSGTNTSHTKARCSMPWPSISFYPKNLSVVFFLSFTVSALLPSVSQPRTTHTHFQPGPVHGAIGTSAEPISQITFPAATSEWFSIRLHTGQKSQDPRAGSPRRAAVCSASTCIIPHLKKGGEMSKGISLRTHGICYLHSLALWQTDTCVTPIICPPCVLMLVIYFTSFICIEEISVWILKLCTVYFQPQTDSGVLIVRCVSSHTCAGRSVCVKGNSTHQPSITLLTCSRRHCFDPYMHTHIYTGSFFKGIAHL